MPSKPGKKKNTEKVTTDLSVEVQEGGQTVEVPTIESTEVLTSNEVPVESTEVPVESTKVSTGTDVTKPKKGGGKKKVQNDQTMNEETSEPVQKGGKEKENVKDKKETPVAKAKGKGKGKSRDVKVDDKVVKTTKKKESKKQLDDKTPEEESDGEKKIRSFKVKLPNKEEFEGRFTGLTPYQAANKALSKYFRENDNPQAEITFSICESTRKSKKTVYSYVGRRQKLETPVTYKIQDGRIIEKNFKNSLKKVKKADIVNQ